MIKWVIVIYCTIGLLGCKSRGNGVIFNDILSYFENLRLGTDHSKIESDLNLPKPANTLVGSSKYYDRTFEYICENKMTIVVGFKQIGTDENYESGEFRYIGHFRVMFPGGSRTRWVYSDGLIIDESDLANKNDD